MIRSRCSTGKIIVILLAVIAALCALIPVSAFADNEGTETKLVRLGYVNEAGYEEGLEGEYKTGLGYEYFQNIAYLKNWKYEYVYGSFSELFQMLADGEIDVFGNLSYTPERAELFYFSDYAMGKDVYHVTVLAGNSELRQGDLNAYNGKKIGVTKDSYQAKLLDEWLAKNNLDMEVVEFEGSKYSLEALDKGGIDCIAHTKLINQEQYAATFYLGSSDYYFGVSKQRPDLLEDINSALYTIQTENPLYNERLSAKYEKNVLADVLLTEPERKWLDAHPEILIGYIDNYLPFSDTEKDGSMAGALPVIMDTLRERLHLENDMQFRYAAYNSADELINAVQTGEVNIAFPMLSDLYYSEENGMMQSYGVVSSAVTLVHKQYDAKVIKRIGVIEGNEIMRIYTELNYPDCEIVYFRNTEECLNAVDNGQIDGSLFLMSRAQYFLAVNDHSDLFMTLCPDNAEFVFTVKQGESALLRILNRGITATDSSYLFAVLNEYVLYDNEFSLKDFIVNNLAAVLIIAAVVVLLICTAALVYVFKIRRVNGELRRALENYKQADSDRRTDFLTGLHSRQDMFEMLRSALAGEQRSIAAMFMMDVDNFKLLNDNFGHTYGDECLQRIGSALTEYGKEHDMVFYRYGGEEILGLCFSAEHPADAIAWDLVRLVREQKILRNDVPSGIVTISLGYTTNNQHSEKMIDMADAALYKAKETGKNKAVCYETMDE